MRTSIVEWKKVGEYYEVSRDGRVRSIDRKIGLKFYKGKTLKENTDSDGYAIVGIRLGILDKLKTRKIHRLVAEAFIPNPKNKATVNHKDSNKKNNNDWNLEWATFGENNTHSHTVGTHQSKGAGNGRAVLTDEIVTAIRQEYALGKTSYPKLAKKHGVSISQIFRIVKKQQWLQVS